MKKKIAIAIIALISMVAIVYLSMSKEKSNNYVEENYEEEKTDIVMSDEATNEIEDGLLGILKIEKIGLEAPVKEGSTEEILKYYVGHIEETPVYDGNVGLAAHNRGNEFSYFGRLNELLEGDIVTYKTTFGTRDYKVDKIEVILETDWTSLANTETNKLTMITCISNRPTQRLCVQAVQI